MFRIMIPRTLAVLGLTALVFACGGSSGTDDGGLYASHFTKIADGGIDDRINAYPWATELFDGDGDGTPEIYIGTLANALCMQSINDLPPERWQCPNEFWNPDDIRPYFLACLNPAVIFRGTYQAATGTFAWDRVFEPPTSDVIGFRGAKAFKDALYMVSGVRLGTVFKSTDGATWAPASPPPPHPMGLLGGFRGAVEFQERLYVANDSVGEIWSSDDPSVDPASWAPGNSRGFVASGGGTHEIESFAGTIGAGSTMTTIVSDDIPEPQLSPLVGGWQVQITDGPLMGEAGLVINHTGNTMTVLTPFSSAPTAGTAFRVYDPARPDNGPCWTLGVHGGYLYASSTNFFEGTILWRSANPAPGNWEKVIENGYHRPGLSVFASLRSFGDDLYIGSLSYPLYYTNGIDDSEPCEMLRLLPDDSVEVLVGDTRPAGTPGTSAGAPLSGIEAGFGQQSNLYVWRTVVHDDGWLYTGTCDFAGILRDSVTDPADLLLINTTLGASGFDLWRTQDGVRWLRLADDGWGNSDAYGVRNFLVTPWGLLVCVADAVHGFELWLGRR